jgi:hypothetical protein
MYIQVDQKVFVHLMITIQKVTSKIQSVPCQSPEIVVILNCVQYSMVYILNIFCDGHLQIINCVGIVQIQLFIAPQRKKSGEERSGYLGAQMVVEMILSANTSSKSAVDIGAV